MSDKLSDNGSLASSFSAAQPGGLDGALGRVKESDEQEDSLHWTTGIHGVLYTISKERVVSWQFAAFRLAMDFLQLYLLVVAPSLGWSIDASNPGWKVFSFIGLDWVIPALGYRVFLALLYIMVVLLIMVVALSVWVAYSFRMGQFDYVWPVSFLRSFSLIFFQVLDIATMSFLLVAMDCQYLPEDESNKFYLRSFPDVACLEMPHMIHLAVAGLSFITFVIMAGMVQLAEIELNPRSANPLAIGHTTVEFHGFMLKVAMTMAPTFLTRPKLAAVVFVISSILLFTQYARWIPHQRMVVNQVRIGSYAAVATAAVLLMVLVYGPHTDSFADLVTLVLYAATAPAFAVGLLVGWVRTRWFMVHVLNRFRAADPHAKPHQIFWVTDVRQVEILVRHSRTPSKEDDQEPDPSALALTELIIKHGLASLPDNAMMIIIHSSFMIDVQSSYQSGYTQLQDAKKCDPSALERFAIFSREQQHTQQAASDGRPTNLVNYVEVQSRIRLITRVHRETLVALRSFWSNLMSPRVTLQQLSAAVKEIDKATKAADRTYKMVMNPTFVNARIMRLYAKFLEDVKQDPWTAAKWFAEAEKLDAEELENKNNTLFGELGLQPELLKLEAGLLTKVLDLLNTKDGVLTRLNTRSAVVIINAQGIVQLASSTVARLLGYTHVELKGKNINAIIPSPFAELHTGFIRQHVMHGTANIIGQTTSFVAMHKDRPKVVHVAIRVSKISGIGEDTCYLGYLEEVAPKPDTANAWVMLGSESVVAVDEAFTNAFGWRTDELFGTNLGAWLQNPGVLNKCIADLNQRSDPAHAGNRRLDHSTSIPPKAHRKHSKEPAIVLDALLPDGPTCALPITLTVRHKWIQSITCKATFHPGVIGSYGYGVITFHVDVELMAKHHLLVADKAGKVLHVEDGLATALGTTRAALEANNASGAVQALMPQPFAVLHVNYLTVRAVAPHSEPPPHSCRAGLSILLNKHSGDDGPPTLQPFRIRVTSRFLPPPPGAVTATVASNEGPRNAERVHVVELEQVTMAQALGDRRVRVAIDETGRVQYVSPDSTAVFGFNPLALHGKVLGDFVQGLSGQWSGSPEPPSSTAQQPNLMPSVFQLTGQREDSALVREDGKTAAHVPPVSDGIREDDPMSPLSENNLPSSPTKHKAPARKASRFSLLAGGGRPGDEPGESLQGTRQPTVTMQRVLLALAARALDTPGISWRVGVVEPGAQDELSDVRAMQSELGLVPRPKALPGIMSVSMHTRRHAGTRPASAGLKSAPSGTVADEDETDALDVLAENAAKGYVMVVDVWKAESCVSVLELDGDGAISHSTALPLYPAGLLFGCSSNSMIGQHLAEHIPIANMDVQDLFEAALVGANSVNSDMQKKRSALKGMTAVKKATGPLKTYTTLHKTDGQALQLDVQAVHKRGQVGTYVVVRLSVPTCGPLDLCALLLNGAVPKSKRGRKASLVVSGAVAALAGAGAGSGSYTMDSPMKATRRPQPPSAAAVRAPSSRIEKFMQQQQTASSEGMLPDVAATTAASPAPAALQTTAGISSLPDAEVDTGKRARRPSTIASKAHALLNGLGKEPTNGEANAHGSTRFAVEDDLPPPPDRGEGDSGDDSDTGPTQTDIRTAQWVISTGGAGSLEEGEREEDSTEEGDKEEEDEFMTGLAATLRQGSTLTSQEQATRAMVGAASRKVDPNDIGDQHSASKEESDAPEDAFHVATTDYKRGARFKKLLRILGSKQVQEPVNALRTRTIGLLVLLMASSIGLFVLKFELLLKQKSGVNDLYSVGVAARTVGRITQHIREMDLLLNNRGLPTLPGLTNMTDMEERRAEFVKEINLLKELHSGVYMGFGSPRALPEDFGLRALWDDNMLAETVFLDGYPNTTHTTQNTSLWKAGNRFISAATDVWANGEAFFHKNGYFWQMTSAQAALMNGPEVVIPAYYSTLDAYLQLVVKQGTSLDHIQLLIAVLEGMLVCTLATLYVWALGMRVTRQQFQIFQVFIMVPQGLVRALATRPIVLEDGEGGQEEEDGGEPVAATKNGDHHDGGGLTLSVATVAFTAKQATRFQTAPANPSDEMASEASAPTQTMAARAGAWLQWAQNGVAGLWRTRRLVLTTGKRKLNAGYSMALWLCWPVFMLGILILVLDTMAYRYCATTSKPIAILNIVNFFAARFQRVFFYGQELSAELDPVHKEELRQTLIARFATYDREYTVMLFGYQAVSNVTEVRFKMAEDGIASSRGSGVDLLFTAQGCMRQNKTTCLPPTDPLYEVANFGLDRLVQSVADHTVAMYKSLPGPNPGLNSSFFDFLWRTKQDMNGGLETLAIDYHAYVMSVFNHALDLYIINLSLVLVFSVAYFFLLVRPFVMRLQNDTRRMAELLSQLPAEISAEDLVMQSLELNKPSSQPR